MSNHTQGFIVFNLFSSIGLLILEAGLFFVLFYESYDVDDDDDDDA